MILLVVVAVSAVGMAVAVLLFGAASPSPARRSVVHERMDSRLIRSLIAERTES